MSKLTTPQASLSNKPWTYVLEWRPQVHSHKPWVDSQTTNKERLAVRYSWHDHCNFQYFFRPELYASFPEKFMARPDTAWLLHGIKFTPWRSQGRVRPSVFFREGTVWFSFWRSHGKAWHGLTSSGNKLRSSFPEEVGAVSGRVSSSGKELYGSFPEEVTAWLLQGMNCVVHSLKKSGYVIRMSWIFQEMNHSVLSLKQLGLTKYWKLVTVFSDL